MPQLAYALSEFFFYRSIWLYTTNALKFALTSGPTREKRNGFIFVPCEQPKHRKSAGGDLVGSAPGTVKAVESLQPTERSLGAVLPLFLAETIL